LSIDSRVQKNRLNTSPSSSPSGALLLKRMQTVDMDLPQNKEKQQQTDEDADNTLSKEIGAWKDFKYALKEDNRLLFNRMLSECGENEDYVRAASSRDKYFSAESLFMVLILQQQKMITELIAKVSEYKK
jgi:hypothetical protein